MLSALTQDVIDTEQEQDVRDAIVAVYVVYYGRPPDPTGLAWWADNPNGYTSLELIESFGDSHEFERNFGDFTPTQLINNLYQQAFNRDAYPEVLAFYEAQLAYDPKALASIALEIVQGADDADVKILQLKVDVAAHFTETLGETVCDGIDYGSHTYNSFADALVVRNFLFEVTDPSMLETFKTQGAELAHDYFLTHVPACDSDPILAADPDPDPDPVIDPGPIVDPDPVIVLDTTPPVFFSGSYEQKNENLPRWNPVYDAQAVDSSGEIDVGITYTLPVLKWDNGLFTINEKGVVYFRQIPDYENPLDGGRDNSYTLLIEASDEYGNTSDKIVNLKILDVDENTAPQEPPPQQPPEIILNPFPEYNPENDDIEWSLWWVSVWTNPESLLEKLILNAKNNPNPDETWIAPGPGELNLLDDHWDYEETYANGGLHYVSEDDPTFHLYIAPGIDVDLF